MRKFLIGLTCCLLLSASLPSAYAGIVGELAADKIYSVNVIAYENCPNSENAQRIAVLAGFTDNNKTGQTLVTLDKTNKIFLSPGETFRVLASNACSTDSYNPCTQQNGGACLQLPDPDPEEDGSLIYNLWVRLVGPPDTGIDVYLCAFSGGLTVCDSDHFVKMRPEDPDGTLKPSFTNATNELLKFGSYSLFNSIYQNYFWAWDTTGKPHAQVWFVDVDD